MYKRICKSSDLRALLCNGVAMARTAAERQAAYRKNRATAGDNGERRINVWVSTATALALQRLARRGAVTQRSVIEELVLAADEQAAAGLTEEEWAEYFSVHGNAHPLPRASSRNGKIVR